MKKVWLRNLSLALAVALLLSAVPAMTIVAASITGTDGYIVPTVGLADYDVDHPGNLFKAEHQGDIIVDAKLEDVTDQVKTVFDGSYKSPYDVVGDYSVSDGVVAKSGNNCAKIFGKSNFYLPNSSRGLEQNTYYLFSFYVYAKEQGHFDYGGFGFRERDTSWAQFVAPTMNFYSKTELKAGQWNKVSMVVYTGKRTLFALTIGDVANTTNCVYLDDFSLIKLPDNVQAAARAFDEYDGDYSSFGATEQTMVTTVGSTFAVGTDFAKLSSAVKSGSTYGDLYKKLMAVNPNSIIGGQAKISHVAGFLEGYGVDHPGNLFNKTDPNTNNTWVDAKLDLVSKITEGYSNAGSKSPQSGATEIEGNLCVQLANQATAFHLPRGSVHGTETNAYYLLSFDILANSLQDYRSTGIKFRGRDGYGYDYIHTTSSNGALEASNELFYRTDLKNGEWNRVNLLIYTGKRDLIVALISNSSNSPVYVDNFSFIKLSDDLQAAMLALDEYKGDFTDDTTALKAAVGDVFADNTYAGLYSVTKPGVKYINSYDQLMANQYTVAKTAGVGGAIEGPETAAQGENVTYTITAADGYVVKDVLVDGSSVGAVTSYTFNRVLTNHSIEAVFGVRELGTEILTVKGATIRKTLAGNSKENVNDVADRQGLRFLSVLTAQDGKITVDGKTYTVTGQGMLLAAASRLGATELTLANKAVNSAIFDGPRANAADKNGQYTTYVYDIKQSQAAIELTTRAYVTCDDGQGGEVIFYSAPITRSVESVYNAIKADPDQTAFESLGEDVKVWFND